MKRASFIIIGFLFMASLLVAQKIAISGIVTSKEDGLPVIGASVVEKGTTNGTITNFDGFYSIQVNVGAVLEFTYVGMDKIEKKVTVSGALNQIMQPTAISIGEVVVTAMGVKTEKKKLNFAVQSVGAEDLTRDNSANFVNSLQGKVAGISVTNSGGSPNSGSRVQIRGISSINSSQSNQPLYVVDGMQVSGGPADINPNDIDNVTVLKGAAASALYGQEAANGVIMITTKRGNEGKVKLNVNSTLQLDNATRVPEIQTKYGPGASGFYKEQVMNGWGPLVQNGETVYDNAKNFFRTGVYQKYDIAASGGSDKFTGYASAYYSDNEGIIVNDYLKKTGIKLQGTYNITKKLTVDMSANITNNTSRDFSGSLSTVYNWPINDDMRDYINGDGSIRWLYLADTKTNSPMNPYWNIYQDSEKTESTRNMLNGSVVWKAFKNFDITGRLSYDQTNSSTIGYLTPRFDDSDFATDEERDNYKDYLGMFFYYQSKSKQILGQAIANYKIDLGNNSSSINLMAGGEFKMREGLSSRLGGSDFVIPGELYSQQNVSKVVNGSSEDVYLFRTEKRNAGFYGEIRYDYKGLAHVSITGRNDYSSTLDPENNSYFYPSVTAGAIFTELFGIRSDLFSYGKIRGNWAKVGKDANTYLFDRKFKQFTAFPDGGYGADPTASVAKALAPEMTTSWEIGADLRFFKDKTKLDIAYYSTLVDNQIVTVRVSPASGNILETRNEGSIENHGIEATLEQQLLKTKHLNWTANLNFGLNRGYVVSLPDQLTEVQGTQYGDIFPVAYLHGSTTAISGKDYERTADGKIICSENGYPVISAAKGNLIGNREPDFLLGISSTLNYKKATVSFLIDTRKGGDVVNVTGRSLYSSGQSKALEFYRNREVIFDGVVLQEDGSYKQNTTPVVLDPVTFNTYFTSVSSNFIEDGSYIRLSYISVGYDLSQFLKSTVIKELKINFTGRNLLLLTRYTGGDPQTNASPSAGGTGSMGIDNFAVPNTRSFIFNLSITL